MFNQKPVNEIQSSEDMITNFWADILLLNSPLDTSLPDDKPSKVIERILQASSFKLNWIVDPFARTGGIGKISKRMGRRFIGFEIDKDKLIVAMKQIDSE